MRKKAWLFIILGVIILIVAIGMVVGFVPTVRETIRDTLLHIIGWISGISITLYGVWAAIPEPMKRLVARILRKIPNLPNVYKRTTIKYEIEGELNAALKDFSKEGIGLTEHEVCISWLTPNQEARESFFREGKAYIKLDFSEKKEKLLVDAAVIYCGGGLLPAMRQYVEQPLMRTIDLMFIDELLERRKAISSRAYFTQEVLPNEIKVIPEIKQYMERLALISQHGLFLHILLPELRDYPGHVPPRLALQKHMEQIIAFVEFLDRTAKDRENKTETGLLHVGEIVRIGIVLVGMQAKLQLQGTKPYVRRTAMDGDNGAHVVYLIGYNLGLDYIPKIAKEAMKRKIADSYEIRKYDALIRGKITKQAIARLTLPDMAGKLFLKEYPDMEAWPDLEDEEENVIT